MSNLAEIVSKNEARLLPDWIQGMSTAVQRADLMSKTELDEQCRALLNRIVAGVKSSDPTNVDSPGWSTTREFLRDLAITRARQGFSPVDVATFVLSLKQPLFASIREAQTKDQRVSNIWL